MFKKYDAEKNRSPKGSLQTDELRLDDETRQKSMTMQLMQRMAIQTKPIIMQEMVVLQITLLGAARG